MSIQSEINRIETEVDDQASLISQIATALEGKAAGGGTSIDTCTINLYAPINSNIGYTSFDGNNILAETTASYNGFVNLDNVMCGSCITVTYYAEYQEPSFYGDQDIEVLYSVSITDQAYVIFLKAPDVNDYGSYTFTIY